MGGGARGEHMVKFQIEQVDLTDEAGQVISAGKVVRFHTVEANTPDDALASFLEADSAVIVGDVLKLPGFQAIATARRANRVYTLQLHPATDRIPIRS